MLCFVMTSGPMVQRSMVDPGRSSSYARWRQRTLWNFTSERKVAKLYGTL